MNGQRVEVIKHEQNRNSVSFFLQVEQVSWLWFVPFDFFKNIFLFLIFLAFYICEFLPACMCVPQVYLVPIEGIGFLGIVISDSC